MATLIRRRVVGILSALFVATVSVTALAVPAHAEDGYQYWNYFHLQGNAWAFSKVGPADYKPKDGDVEGFRYGTSTPAKGIEPRADLAKVSFDTVCGDTKAASGEKRVAVVLDFGVEMGNGTPPEPRAECAVVDEAVGTQQLLQKVTEVRLSSGMLCALDGYPATGCGVPVKNATVPAQEQPVAFELPSDSADQAGGSGAASSSQTQDDSNQTAWTLGGVALLVVLIAAGAVAMSRRNKTA